MSLLERLQKRADSEAGISQRLKTFIEKKFADTLNPDSPHLFKVLEHREAVLQDLNDAIAAVKALDAAEKALEPFALVKGDARDALELLRKVLK